MCVPVRALFLTEQLGKAPLRRWHLRKDIKGLRDDSNSGKEQADWMLEGAGSWQRAKAGWSPNARGQVPAASFAGAVNVSQF